MSGKKKRRRGVMRRRRVFEWAGCLLIASIPIAVLLVAFSPTPTPRPQTAWTTRTAPQTSLLTQIMRPKTAAILDQLATYDKNEDLIATIRGYLTRAGYSVEVFFGTEITVDLYRQLPSRSYGVIILRVHSTSTIEMVGGNVASGAPVYLLTGESHNHSSYSYEQLMGYVCPVRIEAGTFFGIGPEFVSRRMEGRFPDTLIILAGCESLKNTNMAKALIARGASHVIGWSDSVGLEHNDRAIISLTKALFERGLSPVKAITATMEEVGKDPTSKALLLCYPTE